MVTSPFILATANRAENTVKDATRLGNIVEQPSTWSNSIHSADNHANSSAHA